MDSITQRPSIIHIVTGGIDTGKTTRLMAIYSFLGKGDGFVLVKTFDKNSHIGQKIIRLSTGEGCMFSIKKQFLNEHLSKSREPWIEVYSYGDYSFSKKGIEFAEAIVKDVIKKNLEPIFIDEIGPLELNGKGFAAIFMNLLTAEKELYVAVRDSCLSSVISMFNIYNNIIEYI